MKQKIAYVMILSLCTGSLCGCSLQLPFFDEVENTVISVTEEDPPTLGMTPSFDYTVQEIMPSVLVDQTGYLPDSDKKAYFLGASVPDEFEVIDMELGACVYRGRVKSRESNLQSGVYVAYGDFSELQESGEYYIQCKELGYSYGFTISEEVYHSSITQLYQMLTTQVNAVFEAAHQSDDTYLFTEAQMVSLCDCFQILLQTMELFAEDMSGEADGAPDADGVMTVLAFVRDSVEKMESAPAGSDLSEAYLAATEAKLAYIYQNINASRAYGYGKNASTRWQTISNRSVGSADEALTAQLRLGAAELYRYNNGATYHSYFQQNVDPNQAQDGSMADFLSRITYLSTTRKVDTTLCSSIITTLLRSTEDLSNTAKASPYQINAEGEGSQQDNILWNMMILSVVDYVITNHEYTTVLENHLHYLTGCNELALAKIPLDQTKNAHYYAMQADTAEIAGSLTQLSQALMMLHALESAKNTVILES
ncbi:MAG: hypothetical protein K6G23_05740 [Lachnospiraceae bacterium]|nr:hypothetical protein [Lachnospiraceae bacterium]